MGGEPREVERLVIGEVPFDAVGQRANARALGRPRLSHARFPSHDGREVNRR
jgi:hypothetical protein